MIKLVNTKVSHPQAGFVHLFPVLLLLVLAAVVVSANIPVQRQYFDGGNVQGVTSDQVNTSTTQKVPEKFSDQKIDDKNKLKTAPVIDTKKLTPNGIKALKETPAKEVLPSVVEKIKTTAEAEKIKQTIKEGEVKVEFKVENGDLKVKTKPTLGAEKEIESEARGEVKKTVEMELKDKKIKISTDPKQLGIVSGTSGAVSQFPVTIDVASKSLVVTTPAGQKTVTVLPDKAIANILTSRVMTDVTSVPAQGELASVNQLVKLDSKKGVLGYEVKGVRVHKLLGFLPIKTPVQVFVSAENGQVVETQESAFAKILNKLAP